ncbi:hypothetical protein P692DRAFT_20824309 [Suillus brevipes Sb2]|nr:hypothetical protein P692DRAFT_20824309 [Suillus brevipes Sb2]
MEIIPLVPTHLEIEGDTNQHCIKPFSTPEVYHYHIRKVVKRVPNNVHGVSSSVMGTTSTRQFMGLGCTVGMIQRGLLITLIFCLLHGRRDSSLTCNSSVII